MLRSVSSPKLLTIAISSPFSSTSLLLPPPTVPLLCLCDRIVREYKNPNVCMYVCDTPDRADLHAIESRIAILDILPFHHQHNLTISHKFPMFPKPVLTATSLQGLGSELGFASKHIQLKSKATLLKSNPLWSADLTHPVPTMCCQSTRIQAQAIG